MGGEIKPLRTITNALLLTNCHPKPVFALDARQLACPRCVYVTCVYVIWQLLRWPVLQSKKKKKNATTRKAKWRRKTESETKSPGGPDRRVEKLSKIDFPASRESVRSELKLSPLSKLDIERGKTIQRPFQQIFNLQHTELEVMHCK